MTNVAVVMPIFITAEWQRAMTRCAIETLHCTTTTPFSLIIVESVFDSNLSRPRDPLVDVWLRRAYINNPTADINAGLRAAQNLGADICVYTGNDVFVRPGWLEALLECFDRMPDCGVATLASADLATTPAARWFGQDLISEGVYGPFCAFKATERFDDANFPSQFADADLVMRQYLAGKRAYRNNKVVIQHLNKQTINGSGHEQGLAKAQETFNKLYGTCPYLMARVLIEGYII